MPTQPAKLTWITQSDDIEPAEGDRIERKLHALYCNAANRSGFEFRFIHSSEVIPSWIGRPRLWHRAEDLLEERQCYLVSGSSWNGQATQFLEAIQRTIRASNSVLLNDMAWGVHDGEDDKLAMTQIAAGAGLPVLPTIFVPFGRYARRVLPAVTRELGNLGYVIKPRSMSMGFGVLKVDTEEQMTAAIDIAAAGGLGYIVQPYVPNSGDMRVYLINGNLVAAQLRRPAAGRYLANISRGGYGSLQKVPDDIATLSRRLADHLRADYLCVDWLITDAKPVFNEWTTALGGFSGLPEPARSSVADAFFRWAWQRFCGPAIEHAVHWSRASPLEARATAVPAVEQHTGDRG